MWGAEMGVNEHGVCIGNEAVFTKGPYGKTGLTGMDLLRLGLERSATAKEALDIIIDLLEQHGPGGDCGYDKSFFYDNSFLIMDATELYILETAGKQWIYKSLQKGSISNRLALRSEGDAYSGGASYDFTKKFSDPLYSYFSGSEKRLSQTESCLAQSPSLAHMMEGLRTHIHAENPLALPSVKSTCMHAGGLIGDHTTASMIVEWQNGNITVWATGCSTPCISLFKPWRFGNSLTEPIFAAGDVRSLDYWLEHENFHRAAIGKELLSAFYEERDALEASWRKAAHNASDKEMQQISAQAAREDIAFLTRGASRLSGKRAGSKQFYNYWSHKTEQLAEPAKPVVGMA
jgi:hypothetical protein